MSYVTEYPNTYTLLLDDNLTGSNGIKKIDFPAITSPTSPRLTLRLQGNGGNKTISLKAGEDGSLFTVNEGNTLVLANNITLRGKAENTAALVTVDGGKLEMNPNTSITGNTNTHATIGGGGVYVTTSGTFNMYGGTISGNTSGDDTYATDGGGVLIDSGTFTMSGGASISNNTAKGKGGGVYYSNETGTFTLSNGTITNNTSQGDGGGVYIANGTFAVSGGSSIIRNTTGGKGGGVYFADADSAFTLNNGTITRNTSQGQGGGVYIANGTFTMSNTSSSIGNNTTSDQGGGVFLLAGKFEINGGSIGDNISGKDGGGVYLSAGDNHEMKTGSITNNLANGKGGGVDIKTGKFTMSGGTITGNRAFGSAGGVFVEGGEFVLESTAPKGNINGNFYSVTEKNVFKDTGIITGVNLIDGETTNGW
jgi:hypothetical protein